MSQFRVIGSAGVGMPSNTTAHSMAFFKNCLYVGSTAPGNAGPEEFPRILRYRPAEDAWNVVYVPPLVKADGRVNARDTQMFGSGERMSKMLAGRRSAITHLPRDYGYRAMTVFQGKHDPEPALYVASLSLWGSVILRSADGENFETVCEPGFGNDRILSFRGLKPFRRKLFASPAGTVNEEILDRNLAPDSTIYVSGDPVSGRWQKASIDGFGDPANGAIYSLAVAHGNLYAGTRNHERGFQVWRTAAQGSPPYKWERIITDGAYRYNLNMVATTMVEFGDVLYVSSGIPGFGYDRAYDVGPAAAELLRFYADGQWEIVFGEPRFTPDGLKVPVSGLGPGLDDPFNSVIWSMAVHEGVLYIGTHQWEPFERIKAPTGNRVKGGYQIFASRDGEKWEQLVCDGNGNPGATGLRTLLSTPFGLVAGSANHSHLLRLMAGLRGHRGLDLKEQGFEVLVGERAH